MPTVNYKGRIVPFSEVFYPYILDSEGKRNVVYLDDNGNPTVGIGHLVTPGDKLALGQTITNDRVQQLYLNDYNRLSIDTYVSEVFNAGYSYNLALAVGSFIWCHGLGNASKIGYVGSGLRQGIINKRFDAASVQAYLSANWDVRDPENQARNRKDFEVGFSDKPWEPGFFLSQKRH